MPRWRLVNIREGPCFRSSKCFGLFVGRASLKGRGVICLAVETARLVFLLFFALPRFVRASAFDTAVFHETVPLCMTKALASVALRHIIELLWRFDGYYRPADPLELIDVLVVAGGLQVGEEDSQRFPKELILLPMGLCRSLTACPCLRRSSMISSRSVEWWSHLITTLYARSSFGWKVRCLLFWAISWRRRGLFVRHHDTNIVAIHGLVCKIVPRAYKRRDHPDECRDVGHIRNKNRRWFDGLRGGFWFFGGLGLRFVFRSGFVIRALLVVIVFFARE